MDKFNLKRKLVEDVTSFLYELINEIEELAKGSIGGE